ncbi:MAG: hypothetical protein IPP00_07050 [Actinomycetales bacterium]|uniref:Uncharacterized protein n=1 Tax=Candidatus Phosphoribacter hodrii TaxID=2953743 RepID=A0A9D7T905_9MICO|nr:hypothetical protein [Candidatus Phosphoribacter hodrii]
MVTSIHGQLADWPALADDEWSTLLLGNGLSMNLWPGFGYKSLYAARESEFRSEIQL